MDWGNEAREYLEPVGLDRRLGVAVVDDSDGSSGVVESGAKEGVLLGEL